ncbi:hypothetical protein GCM10010106_18170 [Thermopolyspora flexuosa]|nr:hypothetical protein GCM10010106_18170 [Thermopolyspora flexuosa]
MSVHPDCDVAGQLAAVLPGDTQGSGVRLTHFQARQNLISPDGTVPVPGLSTAGTAGRWGERAYAGFAAVSCGGSRRASRARADALADSHL